MKKTPAIAILSMLMLSACGGGAKKEDGQSAPNGAQTSASGCDRYFPGGQAPIVLSAKANEGAKRLCYRAFTVYYSPKSRTPLWSAEMLTEATVQLAHDVPRVDEFHPDPSLPAKDQAQLSDYVHSGYDRGHMTPNGDMPSREAALESFTLTNIVAQAAYLNRGSWEKLEAAVRRQTRNNNDVYVVTGPLFIPFDGKLHTTHTDGRVIIPSHTWKALYVPGKGATVFTATNEEHPHWGNMSVAQFTDAYGINPFPGIPDKYRTVNAAIDGSLTMKAGKGGKNGEGNGQGDGSGGNGQIGPNTLIRDRASGQLVTLDMYHSMHNGRDPDVDEIQH